MVDLSIVMGQFTGELAWTTDESNMGSGESTMEVADIPSYEAPFLVSHCQGYIAICSKL
jgi:hypothetical protein